MKSEIFLASSLPFSPRMLLSVLDVLNAVKSVDRESTLLRSRSSPPFALLSAVRVLDAAWSSWSSTVLACAISDPCPVINALSDALVEDRVFKPPVSWGRACELMAARALPVLRSVVCVAVFSESEALVPAATVVLMSPLSLLKSAIDCWSA